MKPVFKTVRGFTLIEIVVVLGVSVLLISLVISFSRTSEQGIVLINEETQLVNALQLAKAFSIQTFVDNSFLGGLKVCGYGVHFEQDTGYVLFVDTPRPDPTASDCIDATFAYTGNRRFDDFEADARFAFTLDDRVELGPLPGGPGIGFDVVFIPPEPITGFFPGSPTEATIDLRLVDGSAQTSVTITQAGQITTN